MLSDGVGGGMCVLRSFAVFVIIAAVTTTVIVVTTVVTNVTFFDILILFGQTVNVVAEQLLFQCYRGGLCQFLHFA